MRRSARTVAALAVALLVPLPATADAGLYTVNLLDPAYSPSANSWTVPPCEQVLERFVHLPVAIPATSTPAPGPWYPLHGDLGVFGHVQNFYYYTRGHGVNDLPAPGCLLSPPTRDVEVATNASYVGYVTIPAGATVFLSFTWKAETVLAWATASGAAITGACGLLVGGVAVPTTFNAATATCTASATLGASADFFLHGGADAVSATSPLPPTTAYQSTLWIDVLGPLPHHFEYRSSY